ncbi:MAG: type II secretion system F family protein [Planctomycetaceae bacterium]|jgi:type II secretory pathway component PulF|nr:type II secretion system F family protein [Planctomycetaceae bacterium]
MFLFNFRRFSIVQIAGFCRRGGISLGAGIDLIRFLQNEASRSNSRERRCWRTVLEHINDGCSFVEAVRLERSCFDNLFVGMIDVAERSGRLSETLSELADDYERTIAMGREFRSAIFFPVFELVIALVIIGVIILIMGVLEEMTGTRLDMLGLGLVGMPGLITYAAFLSAVFAVGFVMYRYCLSASGKTFQYVMLAIPKVGKLLKLQAEIRLARSLSMTLNSGMDVMNSLAISFDAAAFAPVSDYSEPIRRAIARGESMSEAFAHAGRLNWQLRESVVVGDESGDTPELLDRTVKVLVQDVMATMKQISVLGYVIIFSIVACFIGLVVYRIISTYVGVIMELAQ